MQAEETKEIVSMMVDELTRRGYFVDRHIGIEEYAAIVGRSVKTVYNNKKKYPRVSEKPLLFSERDARVIAGR